MRYDNEKQLLGRKMLNTPFILLTITLFFLIGYTYNEWSSVWVIYLLNLPYYYFAWKWAYPHHKKYQALFSWLCIACYLYVGIGFILGLWHPTWIVFLIALVPIWQQTVFKDEK